MDNNEDTTPRNAPADTIRDRALKAVIWQNEGDKGPYLSISFAKTIEDRDGKLRDVHNFSPDETLRLSELARRAFARSQELRQEFAHERTPDQAQDGDRQARAPRENRSGQDRNSREDDRTAPRVERPRARRSGPSQSY